MTKAETMEFLSKYPADRVEVALGQLGYSMTDSDFPEDIVEKVEAILDAMGEAVDKHKQLQAAPTAPSVQTSEPKSDAIVIQETATIAAEILDVRNISVDPKVLFAVAQSVITQAKLEAAAINQLRRETFVAELRKGQQQMSDEMIEAMQQSQQQSSELFTGSNLRKMVDKAVPAHEPKFNVDEFISEVKVTAAKVTNQGKEQVRVSVAARSEKQVFDVDSFLDEVWE